MARTVICVSHATGAGGRDFGRVLADQLGFRLVDEEVVIRAAESQHVGIEELTSVERRRSRLSRILLDMAAGQPEMYSAYGALYASGGEPPSDPKSLRALIRQSIIELADEGKVVIVSHAASYALTGRDDVLRVLVTAPVETRVRRLAQAEGLEQKPAAKSIADNDAGRADYLKRFYGIGTESPTDYDLVVNTDRISAEKFAELLVNATSL